jgi:hypothetical protein
MMETPSQHSSFLSELSAVPDYLRYLRARFLFRTVLYSLCADAGGGSVLTADLTLLLIYKSASLPPALEHALR